MKNILFSFLILTLTISASAADYAPVDFTKFQISFSSESSIDLSEEDKKEILKGAEVYADVILPSIGDSIFYALGCPGFHGCQESYSIPKYYKLPVSIDSESADPVFIGEKDISNIKIKDEIQTITLKFTNKIGQAHKCKDVMLYVDTRHHMNRTFPNVEIKCMQ